MIPATASAPKDRRVTRCDCQLRARNQTLLAAARIPKRYEHCELASYTTDFPGAHPSLAFAHLSASKFAHEYDPRDGTGLLIIGKIGTGKTHLAVGITKELILNKGICCLFYDYRELLKEIQNSYNATVQTTELDVLRPVFEADVLVLDELGAVKPTEWVWDTVSLILNTRYNDNRTTIITTNFEDQPAGRREWGIGGTCRCAGREPRRPNRRTHALPSARNVPHHQDGRRRLPAEIPQRQLQISSSPRIWIDLHGSRQSLAVFFADFLGSPLEWPCADRAPGIRA